MTLKTWKQEFYAVPANRKMSAEKAIEHSLKKWTGLLKSNLKKHDVYVNFDGDLIDYYDGNNLDIDGQTCALCHKFYGKDYINACGACPLYETLGRKCDSLVVSNSPFILWKDKQDPKPMIKALQETLQNYKEGKLK